MMHPEFIRRRIQNESHATKALLHASLQVEDDLWAAFLLNKGSLADKTMQALDGYCRGKFMVIKTSEGTFLANNQPAAPAMCLGFATNKKETTA
nr:hypothetical protein [uncultured Cohaesibacter sp.]